MLKKKEKNKKAPSNKLIAPSLIYFWRQPWLLHSGEPHVDKIWMKNIHLLIVYNICFMLMWDDKWLDWLLSGLWSRRGKSSDSRSVKIFGLRLHPKMLWLPKYFPILYLYLVITEILWKLNNFSSFLSPFSIFLIKLLYNYFIFTWNCFCQKESGVSQFFFDPDSSNFFPTPTPWLL